MDVWRRASRGEMGFMEPAVRSFDGDDQLSEDNERKAPGGHGPGVGQRD
jgi:hypothetical protein